MTIGSRRTPPFETVFDVVIAGSGHAAYAAAVSLRRVGRTVLVLATSGDLVWESGRAFHADAGTSDDPGWRDLRDDVARRGAVAGRWMDGAITEVVATHRLVSSGASLLYYVRPIALECENGLLGSVVLATRAGMRRVAGRQWIDATETGELLRLAGAGPGRPGRRTTASLMLQHPDWSRVSRTTTLSSTAWATERVLEVPIPDDAASWRQAVLTALEDLEGAIGAEIAQVTMSHLSVQPVARYAAGPVIEPPLSNVAAAVPGFTGHPVATIADRFMLGVEAAGQLPGRDVCPVRPDELQRPLPSPQPTQVVSADVCVAGTGTGGATAALAAARAGATVVCLEQQGFAGGIGTGGGIHGYWFGVPGGLQQQVDRATRELMKRFRGGPLGDGPFNPWAKMIALERMLQEHGVEVHTDALLFGVERRDDRVTAALVATPGGMYRVQAGAFVDGTGDGDLCALAGAEFRYGREYDGLAHTYSQSAGKLRELHGRPRMDVGNFNAGFCDSTDPEDLTRARIDGIRHYLLDGYDAHSRPTYIAPTLGIRQGRQIITEYVLTLDDQIRGRRFDDGIGYTGSHYDNHATDFEFESDEAVFWVWANRQYFRPIACELSYRTLIPKGLANVWIASRCLGVTQDAHYTSRMQRDVQRIGEAAGFAAAEAVSAGAHALQVSYEDLRKWLEETGAASKAPRYLQTGFGAFDFGGGPVRPATPLVPDASAAATEALAALERGEPGSALWWLYQHEPLVHGDVRRKLAESRRPMTGWLAAGVLAMWGDPAAEPRLIEAVATAEYGFGDDYGWVPPTGLYKTDGFNPLEWNKVVPNWLCAVALLRRCGTDACLPALDALLDRPIHGVNTLTTVAVTLERLVRRGALATDGAPAAVLAMLDRILAARVVGHVDHVERYSGRYSEYAVRGWFDASSPVDDTSDEETLPPTMVNAFIDNRWQLQLAVARTRAALGAPMQEPARPYLSDYRAFVRRAFETVT